MKTETGARTKRTHSYPQFMPSSKEMYKHKAEGGPIQEVRTKDKPLRLIPLGGLEEVGRNMMILEYGENILIIDVGLRFPEEDMPGIDFIIPNIEYLKSRKNWIKPIWISKLGICLETDGVTKRQGICGEGMNSLSM